MIDDIYYDFEELSDDPSDHNDSLFGSDTEDEDQLENTIETKPQETVNKTVKSPPIHDEKAFEEWTLNFWKEFDKTFEK